MKIIAELCQNHNGSVEILKEMVSSAALAGATHVKIQNIFVKNLTQRPEFENGLKVGGNIWAIQRPFQSEYDRLKKLELSDEVIRNFIEDCKNSGVTPLTTCFTRDDVIHCKKLGFNEIKVASYDCASFQLLRELRDTFDHVYISTGATFDNEILKASALFSEEKNKFSLLHCVTIYPTQLKDFNLARLNFLKRYCSEVGLSDHSLVVRDGTFASKCAIFLGAKIIERHFTILEEDKTRDGPVSVTSSHLKEITDFSKKNYQLQQKELDRINPNWADILLGEETRTLTSEELLNRAYYRGRFASPRVNGSNDPKMMIFNWEETPLNV